MDGLPRIFVLMAPLGVIADVSVVVVSVEVWFGQVTVRLAAQRGEVTDRLDDAHDGHLARWEQQRRLDSEGRDFPRDPGARLLGQCRLHLSDERGGQYEMTSGQVGGSDTMWRAEWHYRPAPSNDTVTLTVSASGLDAPAAPVVVPLR